MTKSPYRSGADPENGPWLDTLHNLITKNEVWKVPEVKTLRDMCPWICPCHRLQETAVTMTGMCPPGTTTERRWWWVPCRWRSTPSPPPVPSPLPPWGGTPPRGSPWVCSQRTSRWWLPRHPCGAAARLAAPRPGQALGQAAREATALPDRGRTTEAPPDPTPPPRWSWGVYHTFSLSLSFADTSQLLIFYKQLIRSGFSENHVQIVIWI